MTFESVEKMFGPYVGMTLVGIVGAESGGRIEVCFEDGGGELHMLTFWNTERDHGYSHGGMHLSLGTATEYVRRWAGYGWDDCPVVTTRTKAVG